MSKHLLYCKDLLNRTLTRSLLFVLAQLVACLIILTQVVSLAEAAGPLSVKTTNPRYFFDTNGKSVYLTGSYLNEYNTLSGSWDFTSYLDFLQQQKQNFTRVWGWEQSPWIYDNTGQITFSIQPYERTGPGLALDGALRFDLTRFNQAYFDQLRSRVVEATQRGIYVSVMLFEGFSTQKKMGRVNPWLGDPFQQANNINGINGDPNRNGSSEEFFSLAYPSLLALQEAFARKVVDTLNDLDNVLYEVNGNGLAGSLSWQYHMIDYIKRYQKKPANQRPVGISDFYAGAIADVFNSSADWIVIQETNLNPPPTTVKKVLIMEGTPPVSASQVLSPSPISLVQLMPDSVVSSQSPAISNNVPSSNGVTSLSSAAGSSTLTTTQSSSNQQSQVVTPTITPNGGVYSGTVAVTLQTTTPGASIYYTTDGQSPTQSSRLYKGKFRLSDSTLVKAKAFKNNFDPSSEASAWFANTGAVSAPGLLAYWKFDEVNGTTAADASGSGYTGTLVNGPIWTAGRIAGALSFDGVDDYVSFASQPQGTLSASAWVYAQATPGNLLPRIIDMPGYVLYLAEPGASNPMSLGFISRRSTQDGKWTTPANSLAYDTWNHVAVVYDSSSTLNNPDLYINGVKQTISTITSAQGTQTLNGGTGIIGNRIPLDQGWKGIIDDLRVYNRTLSATEIQTFYQQAAPSQTVATPVISPNGGNYSGLVSVTIQTTTAGASIYYTTDGSTPTQSSTLYSGAMTLTNSATVKAKAFKSGSNASAEASASFNVSQPFSFSVSSAGNISVVAGSSVTNSISTTLASGTAQAVTFSASGLPTGATASFSSTSCSPNCSSTMTINTSSSTPAGSSNITVMATGGGVTKTTAFSLTVSLPTVSTVATPTITPNGGSFTSSVLVTMQTATSGASIYYTTDGSTPTQSSTLYTGAMALTSSAVVKAKAFKSGSNASAEASASFNVTPTNLVAHWKFDEVNGTTAADASGSGYTGTLVNGPIWTAGRIAGALSFDGVDDYVSFASQPQGTLSASAWVYAQATPGNLLPRIIDMPGYVLYLAEPGASNPMSLGFISRRSTQDGKWTTPANSLAYDTWNHVAVVYDSSSTLNNPDLYINGVKQTISTITSAQGTQTLNGGTGIIGNRIPLDQGWKGIIDDLRVYNRTLSATEIQTFYQQAAPSQTVATPVISPNGGNYSGLVSVTIQTTTAGASIYYTTDGSTPTQSSTLYSGAMTLTNSATVKAKAFKSGFNASAEASASFNVSQPFSFSVSSAGNISVVAGSSVTNSISTTLASGTAQAVTFSASGLPTGATASFSSTSCSPNCSSTMTINTSSSTPAGSSNITVMAAGGGVTKTTAFSLTVSLPTVSTVATPTITPNGGSFTSSVLVTMQTATSGASIYYTTDGSTPTQSSTLYTGAMALTSSAVVKAKAFKSGSNASAEASASFNVTPTNLVAHWKFDEVNGTTAADASGSGYTGTLVNGPIWTAGRIAGALSFDGVDDYVSFASQPQGTLSVSAWVYAQATPGNLLPRIIDMPGYVLYLGEPGASNPMSLGFISRRSTQDGKWTTPANSLAYDTWNHVAVVYDSSSTLNNPDLYINGVKQTISTITSAQGTQTLNGGTGIIGNRIPLDQGWKGIIDDLRVYNRTLSATEIQTSYQQAAPVTSPNVTPGRLILSWQDTSNNEDDFQLERKIGTNGLYIQIALVSANVTSYVDSGLTGGTTYCYRVSALNSAGISGFSNEACDTAP